MSALAAPTFTGDAHADFAIANAVTIDDAIEFDVGLPVPPFTMTTVSGHDMDDVNFYWDRNTDILYVGIDTYGVALDADGDGDPGATSPELLALLGMDVADMGGTESFGVYFDIDQDGQFDIISGVSANTNVAGFTTAAFAGLPTVPAFAFGAPLPALTGSLFANPSASAPDVEFTIPNFSTVPLSSGVDTAGTIDVGVFMGSFSDDGIGEDFILNVVVDFERCGDGVVSFEEECDDGNNIDGDGCNANCETEFCGDGVVQAGEEWLLPSSHSSPV